MFLIHPWAFVDPVHWLKLAADWRLHQDSPTSPPAHGWRLQLALHFGWTSLHRRSRVGTRCLCQNRKVCAWAHPGANPEATKWKLHEIKTNPLIQYIPTIPEFIQNDLKTWSLTSAIFSSYLYLIVKAHMHPIFARNCRAKDWVQLMLSPLTRPTGV